ncbi:hypothetical protein SCLCIDRAFT_1019220 [Scleroderma citrinum Foug A]|uniref:Uncharacterized protein n=1 Tax=Scleroderma citrinum Foug A TaxID=1036808 RepID=A0A0C3DTT9_9AGAM|nr:hypothetical protein SCLCIDRAFT_1019220 [Scleroderma citrinum Foug A]
MSIRSRRSGKTLSGFRGRGWTKPSVSMAPKLRSWIRSLTGSITQIPPHHVSSGSAGRQAGGNLPLRILMLCRPRIFSTLGRALVRQHEGLYTKLFPTYHCARLGYHTFHFRLILAAKT